VTGNDSAADLALLGAALRGDERAMRDLVRRHGPRLRACALRTLHDESMADEVVQDVFAVMLRSGHAFRRDANLGTWLYAIALNRCRNINAAYLHDAGRKRPVDEKLRDPLPDPHSLFERSERRDRLACATAALPEELREVIVLRFAGGRSYQEIAEIHGCAVGTVASRIHRALRQLGETLRKQGLTPENL
jgi:RNA polymerase sigma-70 factor (ECF subfamily)